MAWKLFPHTHAHKRKLCTSHIETYIHITHSPYCFRISLERRKCSLVVQNYNVKRNGQEAVTHHPCIQIPYNISLLNKTQSDNLCSLSSGWCVHGHRTNASLFFPMHCPNNHFCWQTTKTGNSQPNHQSTGSRCLSMNVPGFRIFISCFSFFISKDSCSWFGVRIYYMKQQLVLTSLNIAWLTSIQSAGNVHSVNVQSGGKLSNLSRIQMLKI